MTKQEEFNRIKAVIENPKNTFQHLEVISVMVEMFQDRNQESKLSMVLLELLSELELKLLK